ncbi:hypothetical protein [Seonamhaeicola sp. ML3]|uniref:hypothetical protein n=1 Tax=Seonamhaeicola sp. ML3 TaxID=2937786 RepID=UPI00200F2532|nr:hypothetical protein [Seonamhaeicola sp. ML3]
MRKIIALALIVLSVSCQKDETPLNDSGPSDEARTFYLESFNEYNLANQIFQDLVNIKGDIILNAENSLTGKTNTSKIDVSVSIEPSDLETFPKTITVDFGPSGTVGRDGVFRRGVIRIVSTGWFWEQGSVHTTTFSNYFHDNFRVEGTQIVQNFGENENGFIEFDVEVNNGVISHSDGLNITFEEASTRTWIVGSQTPFNIWDDEYIIDAIQSGFFSDGTSYSLTFDEPLHYVLLPRAVRSGIVNLVIGGFTGFEINHNNRTTTILGVTSTF